MTIMEGRTAQAGRHSVRVVSESLHTETTNTRLEGGGGGGGG